jgi:cytochrome c-type biogenesis protein CcmH/NrfF
MIASFTTASLLTLLLPLALLVAVGVWWVVAARRRESS